MRDLSYRVYDKKWKEYSDKAFSLDQHGILYVQDEDGYWEEASDRYIIELSTGLEDKNGKVIREGDIVKMARRVGKDGSTLYKVVWDDLLTGYDLINLERSKVDVGYLNKYNIKENFEVIGNIHENAELLGAKE